MTRAQPLLRETKVEGCKGLTFVLRAMRPNYIHSTSLEVFFLFPFAFLQVRLITRFYGIYAYTRDDRTWHSDQTFNYCAATTFLLDTSARGYCPDPPSPSRHTHQKEGLGTRLVLVATFTDAAFVHAHLW